MVKLALKYILFHNIEKYKTHFFLNLPIMRATISFVLFNQTLAN